MELEDINKQDAMLKIANEIQSLLQKTPPSLKSVIQSQLEGFQNVYNKFISEIPGNIQWEKIQKLSDETIWNHEDLIKPTSTNQQKMLEKLVVVKLNGGLGTSMACHGPKSLIPVRSTLTFLDLTIKQMTNLNMNYNVNIPLVLMNSFNTDQSTQKYITNNKKVVVDIHTFNQSTYPRLHKETLLPIANSPIIDEDPQGWYPPGHGDFYESFRNSGLLDKFIKQGKEFIFISNIDNLGATVDINILNLLDNTEHKCEFIVEVTNKTKSDVKGGTIIQYENNLQLLELAQVPKSHMEDFICIKTFNIFSTNNIWISLKAIERKLDNRTLDMEVIANYKTLDNGMNIIQLEQAVGAAIKSFKNSIGVNVPRSRFLPVKKTDDLMLVRSNLYSLNEGRLVVSHLRQSPHMPLVKLDPHYFSKVKDFLIRFPSSPDLLELEQLTVSGDVHFGEGVSLRGIVTILANEGEKINIPPGAILENVLVSGNLKILNYHTKKSVNEDMISPE